MPLKTYTTALRKLAMLTAFCLVLEIARMFISHSINYIFLPWNLLLAWIPLWLSNYIISENKKGKLIFLFSVWLLFFPNAPYLITDLIHLKPRGTFPFWYDMLMCYSYAFTGLMLGMLSVLVVYQKLKAITRKLYAQVVILFAMMASGYGIYMGRFLRWNSWDALLNPFSIVADTAERIFNPTVYPRAYGVTLIVGVFLFLTFLTLESFTNTEEVKP